MTTVELLRQISELVSFKKSPEYVDGITDDFLNSIIQSIETSKMDSNKKQQEHDLYIENLQHKLKITDNKYHNQSRENEELSTRLNSLNEKFDSLNIQYFQEKKEIEKLKNEIQSKQDNISRLESKLSHIELERGEQERLLERKQVDLDASNIQLEQFLTKFKQLREEMIKIDSNYHESLVKANSLQIQNSSHLQEMEKMKKQMEIITNEREELFNEYSKFRKETNSSLFSLKLLLDSKNEELNHEKQKTDQLTKFLQDQDSSLSDLLRKNKELTDKISEQEIDYSQELQAKTRLADLYQQACEESSKRIDQLESELSQIKARRTSGKWKIKERNMNQDQNKNQNSPNIEIDTDTDIDSNLNSNSNSNILQSNSKRKNREMEMEILQKKLDQKNNQIEQLNLKLQELSNALNTASRLSPSAAAAQIQGQKSFGEIYSEYANQKIDLIKADQEIQRLKKCLQEICQDIEARMPLIEEERKENLQLKMDISSLSEKLVSSINHENELQVQFNEILLKFHQIEQENKSLILVNSDLSKQIQSLLIQLEHDIQVPNLNSIESSSNLDINSNSINSNNSNNSNSTFTSPEQNVIYHNVIELQLKNQELLQNNHLLETKLKEKHFEQQRFESKELQGRLSKALEEIQEMHNIRKRQQVMIESLTRQRDALKEFSRKETRIKKEKMNRNEIKNQNQNDNKTLQNQNQNNITIDISSENENENSSSNDNSKLENEIENNQIGNEMKRKELEMEMEMELKAISDFELFKREEEKTREILQSKLENAQNQFLEIKLAASKSQTQLEFTEERFKILQKNYEMERKELASLRQSNSECLESIIRHQSSIQELVSSLVESKEREQKLSCQLASVNVEVEMLKSTEKRLVNDGNLLMMEREKLIQLLNNLQSIKDMDMQSSLKEKLNEQLEFLERDLLSTRRRLMEESESHRLATIQSEKEYRELLTRYEQQLESLTVIRDESSQLRIRILEAESKITDLTAENEIMKKRFKEIGKFKNKNKNKNDNNNQNENQNENDDNNENYEINQARINILKEELNVKQCHLEQARSIAICSEKSLSDLGIIFDQYKREMEEEINGKSKLINKLTEEIEGKNEEIKNLSIMISNLKNESKEEKDSLDREKNELREKVILLQDHIDRSNKNLSTIQIEDLARLEGLLKESKEQYDLEIVSHGRDLERLANAKNEINQLIESIGSLKQENEQLKNNSNIIQIKMDQSQGENEKIIKGLELKCQEMQNQNSILLDQIDKKLAFFDNSNNLNNSFIYPSSPSLLEQDEQEMMNEKEQDEQNDKVKEQEIDRENLGKEMREFANPLKEIVKFLRRQKDLVECERDNLMIELKRYKNQWEQAARSLDETKALLDSSRLDSFKNVQMQQEYNLLLEKVDQLNILRESNTTLRNQVNDLGKKCNLLKDQLEKSQNLELSHGQEMMNLRENSTILHDKIKELEEELGMWKERFNNLIATRTDPKMIEELKSQIHSLKEQLEEGKLNENREKDLISSKLVSLEAKYKNLISQCQTLKSKNDEYSKKIIAQEGEKASLAASVASAAAIGSPHEISNLQSQIEKLESKLVESESKFLSLQDENNKNREKLTKYTEALRKMASQNEKLQSNIDLVKSLQSELETIKKENDLRTAAINSNWKGKVNKLQEKLNLFIEKFGELPLSQQASESNLNLPIFSSHSLPNESELKEKEKEKEKEMDEEEEELESESNEEELESEIESREIEKINKFNQKNKESKMEMEMEMEKIGNINSELKMTLNEKRKLSPAASEEKSLISNTLNLDDSIISPTIITTNINNDNNKGNVNSNGSNKKIKKKGNIKKKIKISKKKESIQSNQSEETDSFIQKVGETESPMKSFELSSLSIHSPLSSLSSSVPVKSLIPPRMENRIKKEEMDEKSPLNRIKENQNHELIIKDFKEIQDEELIISDQSEEFDQENEMEDDEEMEEGEETINSKNVNNASGMIPFQSQSQSSIASFSSALVDDVSLVPSAMTGNAAALATFNASPSSSIANNDDGNVANLKSSSGASTTVAPRRIIDLSGTGRRPIMESSSGLTQTKESSTPNGKKKFIKKQLQHFKR